MIVSDGSDWTRRFLDEDFSYIRHIYELFGAADNVQKIHFALEKHDYGPNKRRVVYEFFYRALHTGPSVPETAPIESQYDQAVRNWVDSKVASLPEPDPLPKAIVTEPYLFTLRETRAAWSFTSRLFTPDSNPDPM
jgi:hypothetical protein